ncbi:MAG: hypothetical protein M1834_001810 [Cirrosporium novae-zelandiae]|nr:MAG: hypothetical protein M1834_001810 [Cirrosporium novae-zelandiae]
MALEDFEKSLEESQEGSISKSLDGSEKEKDKREHREHRRHRHHHHHRSTHKDREHENRHRYKRSHNSRDEEDDERRPKRRQKGNDDGCLEPPEGEEDEWVEKDASPVIAATSNKLMGSEQPAALKRDSWMEAPNSIDIDYIQRNKPQPAPRRSSTSLHDEFASKLHKNELNRHLHDLQESDDGGKVSDEPVEHTLNYIFGDAGAQWRMMKLKAVYRQAKETGKSVDEIALERYGDLRDFDNAREEEIELDRRETYGKGYVGKEKPSGELFQERKFNSDIKGTSESSKEIIEDEETRYQGKIMETKRPPARTVTLDQTTLNRMKAQMMKAKLRKSKDAGKLETEYNEAVAKFGNSEEPGVVVLGAMENRMLAGGRGEVKAVNTTRGRERGLVEENEDMSVDDMVREERRTRGQRGGEGVHFAERIAKDAKFDDHLDYLDENASKLAKRVQRSEINLKNIAISDFQKINRILDTCPLCYHDDTNQPPVAPIASLATRVYLTLPTEPELSKGGACIVPIQHRNNLLECDDDEWEEIRNFMKCLTRMYHDQDRDVIFYENAAQPNRHRHAVMVVVPLPTALAETSPAFFKEAILSADDEWTQHKKIYDTLARSRDGLGKLAFRRTLVKEMPYFHVWFELDGGLGHVVEDSNRWPKGDLFAREIIGGMLDAEPDVIKRQGRWERGGDRRLDGFRKRWQKFDWTRILTE